MKGPMTTQSLRGMANHGPMHWRGDRTGGNDDPSAQPDSGTFDEVAAFKKFLGAFPNLLGRDGPIDDADMEAFTDFILQVTYPPNPVRMLYNRLTPEPAGGARFLHEQRVRLHQPGTCASCHVTDRRRERAAWRGRAGLLRYRRPLYLRSAGRKPSRRRTSAISTRRSACSEWRDTRLIPTSDAFLGDQVRGFGFNHDGSIPTIFNFISVISDAGFNQSPATPGGFPPGPAGELQKRQIEDFMLAFDSNLAPIVGQQTTLTRKWAVVGAADQPPDRPRPGGGMRSGGQGRDNHGEKGFLYDVARAGSSATGDATPRSPISTCGSAPRRTTAS